MHVTMYSCISTQYRQNTCAIDTCIIHVHVHVHGMTIVLQYNTMYTVMLHFSMRLICTLSSSIATTQNPEQSNADRMYSIHNNYLT